MRALLPIKTLAAAKQRLSHLLNASERRGLFTAMLHDVLAVLSRQSEVEGIILVSDDPVVADLARRYRCEWMPETPLDAQGLNAVVQAAVSALAQRDIDNIMVVHGDLPLLSNEALSLLIARHRRTGNKRLTLAPDRHRQGSNCLLATPASAFKFHYGADSCNQHLQQAAKSEFDAKVVLNTATGCDIDYPEDLVYLLEHAHGQVAQNTINYLNEQGIAARLDASVSNLTPLQGRQYERVS